MVRVVNAARERAGTDVAQAYRRWMGLRAACHRGWWLVASLYLVVVAGLSPAELVWVGVAQALVELFAEVPTGVVADRFSRRLSLVISHVLIATAMAATGLVTSFSAVMATQMLWGLGWTFASGADVAWVTDELRDSRRIDRVLAEGARAAQLGAAGGILGSGGLAWATGLSAAMLLAALGMACLGVFVVARFPETGFARVLGARTGATELFRRGLRLARTDREILVVVAATFLLNGAAVAFDRLFPKHLLQIGFPASLDPIVWLTVLGLVSLVLGAAALRIVEARIYGLDAPPRLYAGAAAIGVLGLLVLGYAPTVEVGAAGVLLVGGIAWTVTRSVSQIWVNRRATDDVRATLQSFLSQGEVLGELVFGAALAALASTAPLSGTLAMSGALVAVAGGIVLLVRPKRVGASAE